MISIIVTFYNTEKYLEECLTSIKGQTFSDFECLMIDDGSTDSSREIASKFLEDSRFKLLGDKHIGFPLSKNLGLDSAKGEYICFVDSDDYILPQYLELLYKGLIETNSDICSCCNTRFKNTDEPYLVDVQYFANVFSDTSKIKCLLHSTVMWDKIFKKELFNDLRFDDMIALSDTALCYKIYDKANIVSRITPILICHRDHNENMTYRVRHFEPTYWGHRLNIYIDMCLFLIKNYQHVDDIVKREFRKELNFIKPHLSQEIFDSYINREDVKNLIV